MNIVHVNFDIFLFFRILCICILRTNCKDWCEENSERYKNQTKVFCLFFFFFFIFIKLFSSHDKYIRYLIEITKVWKVNQNQTKPLISGRPVNLKTPSLGRKKFEFYGDLVYEFRKIIGKNDFPNHFKKISSL